MPKVSILIVSFNQEDFIAEALSSALEQNYDPLEVVVADDNSTDQTTEVIRQFASDYPKRLIPILGRTNLGITGNSNRALSACTGDYIAWQGGDDILLPNKITKQVEWMTADERRVICYHDVEVVGKDSRDKLGFYSNRHPMRRGGLKEVILHNTFFAATSVMVRTSAIPRGGFDPRVQMISDWLLCMQIVANSGEYSEAIGYIEGVFAKYRRHGSNITSTAANWELEETMNSLDIILENYPSMKKYVRIAKSERMTTYAMKRLFQGELSLSLSLLIQAGESSIRGFFLAFVNGIRLYMRLGARLF